MECVPTPSPTRPAGRLNLLLSCGPRPDDAWADALRTLLEPMGVASFRAASAREVSQLLRALPFHVAIVDLELPFDRNTPSAEPAGPRVLQLLARLDHPPPTILIRTPRSRRDDRRTFSAALRAGAFAVLDPPRCQRDTEILLELLRRVLHRHYHGDWPRPSHDTPAGNPPAC